LKRVFSASRIYARSFHKTSRSVEKRRTGTLGGDF
jgi:hypothetical protein